MVAWRLLLRAHASIRLPRIVCMQDAYQDAADIKKAPTC